MVMGGSDEFLAGIAKVMLPTDDDNCNHTAAASTVLGLCIILILITGVPIAPLELHGFPLCFDRHATLHSYSFHFFLHRCACVVVRLFLLSKCHYH